MCVSVRVLACSALVGVLALMRVLLVVSVFSLYCLIILCLFLPPFSTLILFLTFHPRVTLQSWTTQSSATSSPPPWRTNETCCLETCQRYMNFTTGIHLLSINLHFIFMEKCYYDIIYLVEAVIIFHWKL